MYSDLETFLSFKSISSEKNSEMLKTAEWLRDYLQKLGFSSKIIPTDGHPLVYAELAQAPGKPTVLIYGHYDVQPVDPLELWKHPPFEPKVIEGEIYARGAQDNKGQIFYCIQAMKALLEKGPLPVNVKFLIEGEEEIGSPNLPKVLDENKELFQSDYFLVADCGIPNMDTPAITLGLRGIVSMDVVFRGSKSDLHSGQHGGLAFNPNHALIQTLAALRSPEGKILVPGFYDDVVMAKDEFYDPYTAESYLKEVGCLPTGGEKGFRLIEKGALRPTLEINGIHGGYAGNGFKTVIPKEAIAKISCRLVPNQDPHVIGDLVKRFIESKVPEGIEVQVDVHNGTGDPVRANADSPIVLAMKQAYEEVFQKPCRFIMEGASIPIVSKLIKTVSSDFVLMGLGLPGDAIHAPNEHFGLNRYEMGAKIIARSLSILS